MQDIKEKKLPDKKKTSSILSMKAVCRNLRKFFLPWLIVSAVVAVLVFGINSISNLTNRVISVTVNFSFDGVESGHDPLGNTFHVDEVVDKSAVEEAVKELEIENADIQEICSSISIRGNIPNDVINRIINHTSIYGTSQVNSIQKIQDTTYYPTQYIITMDCYKLDMKFKDCVALLNNVTEKYKNTFAEKYGYKESLANAVTSFDYNDYDYIDSIDVLDSSLESLESYINELASKDSTRFRSEQTGYTFSDLVKSIETIRTEDLEIISSYITLYNMTKDKENLITNYEYRIEEYERQKKINEEKLDSIAKILEVYEKNSILIFSNATSGTDAALNQSSDTYDNLIEQQVLTETEISKCQQEIDKYNKRIKNLNADAKKGSVETLEKEFEDISNKVNTFLETVRITVNEYYNDIAFKNAYEILTPATSSTLSIILTSVKEMLFVCAALEMIILAIYILICCIAVNEKVTSFVTSKLTGKKNTAKKSKSKGGRK